ERDRNRAGGDADVARRQRDESCDVEGGDDHDRGGERMGEAEGGADGGGRDEAAGGGDGEPTDETGGSGRLFGEGAEGIEDVRVAPAGDDRDDDGRCDEANRDEERPERDGSGEVAGDDERSEHDSPRGAEGGEGAAGREQALFAWDDAGEEPDSEGVAC